jgi:hypothetical protein
VIGKFVRAWKLPFRINCKSTSAEEEAVDEAADISQAASVICEPVEK